MRIKFVLAVMMCCGAIFCSALTDEPSHGIFAGVITDSSGAIIPEATIRVQHWVYDEFGHHPREKCDAEVYTDGEGRFSIRLPVGGYDVFIAYPGFAATTRGVRIKSGQTTTLNVELAVDPLTTPLHF